ncbi:MAG TPA: YihY/virulence factor BrkB family protein [Nocardioidaceae bacterium]|nr:YihY/virulence factor BrkB family protein [Nocardioidaceae bacterium]
MASFKDRAKARIDRIRARHRFVDHLFATVTHYGTVNGNAQAGAVTFFGFLSFFPILALAFFVIGYISRVYPDAQDQLVTALGEVLPGVVGEGPGEISLATFEENASAIGIIGLVGVLYSGLGWLSGMRDALEVMFLLPKKEQPNFFLGKARDLMVLAVIGFVLIVSVALSGAISGFSEQILALVELEDSFLAAALLWLLGHALAIAATTLLLVAMFKLLAKPHVPRKALVHGAVLGAVGFEVLKSLAAYLIASTKDQPAFQAFGVALILVVWINYFSRLVMYGAAWAYTSPLNDREAAVAATGGIPRPVGVPAAADEGGARKTLVAAGAAAALVAAGVIARRRSGRMVS